MIEMEISKEWTCECSYLDFKGSTQGIKTIPLSKEEGHCPSLRLHLNYLDKTNEIKQLSYEQFKYLIRKFKKEIKSRGYTNFILEFGIGLNLGLGRGYEINQNLYTLFVGVRGVFDKIEGTMNWRDKDKRLIFTHNPVFPVIPFTKKEISRVEVEKV